MSQTDASELGKYSLTHCLHIPTPSSVTMPRHPFVYHLSQLQTLLFPVQRYLLCSMLSLLPLSPLLLKSF